MKGRILGRPLKIHIYTDIGTLFGQACRLWMNVLLAAGHEVELVELGTATDGCLPDVGQSDVNLIIAGIYAFETFGKQGLPRHGKHILWMLDPLTSSPLAGVHRHKAALFAALAPQLDLAIAMDEPIERYLNGIHPHLATARIPYLVAEHGIAAPKPQGARVGRAIFMGGSTLRRSEAGRMFSEAGVPADFVWSGLWGKERDLRLREAPVALSIHADGEHTYFDQFRALHAWAAGTVVLTETTDGLAPHGIETGVHLAMANLPDMPRKCEELMRDTGARQAMVMAAQALLRDRFSPQRWTRHMLAAIHTPL